jgi:hypothetical protein
VNLGTRYDTINRSTFERFANHIHDSVHWGDIISFHPPFLRQGNNKQKNVQNELRMQERFQRLPLSGECSAILLIIKTCFYNQKDVILSVYSGEYV